MATFASNPIMSLTAAQPRHDLSESYGPNLRLGDLLTPELADHELGYGTAPGSPALRTAIADRHGVRPDDVVVTVGGMHAIFLLAYLLADRGGQVVTTGPEFPITRSVFETVGSSVRVVPLTFDEGYRLSAAAIRAQLTPETRLVSLATPQNPSGVAVPHDTLRDIVVAMREICPDAYLMVDETYRIASYGDDPVAGTALDLGPNVVVVGSLSKCHGAAGLRIGWAISTDAGLIEQLRTGKFSTVVSASTVAEALAVRVFEEEAEILTVRRAWLRENLELTEDWVRANADVVEWIRPDAGALCVIRFARTVDLERFRRATAEAGVRLADGDWFGDEPRVFRLGFGFLPATGVKVALEAVQDALREAVHAAH